MINLLDVSGFIYRSFFAMPRIFRNEIADWFVSLANDLQNLQLDGILVRGYEELAYCRQYLPECKMITDQNVYTYNDRAQQFFADISMYNNWYRYFGNQVSQLSNQNINFILKTFEPQLLIYESC